MRVSLRLLVLVALVGVGLGLLAGGGRPSLPRAAAAKSVSCPRSHAATPAASPIPAPATPISLPTSVGIGRPADFGPLRLTVTSVEGLGCVVGPQTWLPRGVFLAVTLQAVANGPLGGEGEFPVAELRVVDRRGEVIEPILEATAALSHQRGLPIPMLAPLTIGVPATVVVVFDVPRDATSLVLTSSDGAFAIRLVKSGAGVPGA